MYVVNLASRYINHSNTYTNLPVCTRPCVTVSLSQDETKDFECVSENHTREADERKEDYRNRETARGLRDLPLNKGFCALVISNALIVLV